MGSTDPHLDMDPHPDMDPHLDTTGPLPATGALPLAIMGHLPATMALHPQDLPIERDLGLMR